MGCFLSLDCLSCHTMRKCAIEQCQTTHIPSHALCGKHFETWTTSKEFDRFQATEEEVNRRVALFDFVTRLSAEIRNAK